jgi:hypothetical protein
MSRVCELTDTEIGARLAELYAALNQLPVDDTTMRPTLEGETARLEAEMAERHEARKPRAWLA